MIAGSDQRVKMAKLRRGGFPAARILKENKINMWKLKSLEAKKELTELLIKYLPKGEIRDVKSRVET